MVRYYCTQNEAFVWFFGQLVVPGIVNDVDSAEIAAIPAKTTRARMDERSSVFMGRSPIFLSKGVLVVCVLVNAG